MPQSSTLSAHVRQSQVYITAAKVIISEKNISHYSVQLSSCQYCKETMLQEKQVQ